MLIYAFCSSDFSIETVLLNSTTIQPLLYKVAASWSHHEGSLLFFTSVFAAITTVLYVTLYRHSAVLQCYFSKHFSYVNLLLVSYILFIANPFEISPLLDTAINLKQGFGLNPLLQDSAVAIHPPMLYVGHALYAVIFIIALAYLSTPDRELQSVAVYYISKYSSLSWGLLSAGIALGSWWAYRELGWGGYWFFDPVENISLMPWLLGSILHHNVNMPRDAKLAKPLTIEGLLSALAIFPVIVLGMFLLRSNLITSVHAFATGEMQGVYLLVLFLSLVFYASITYIIASKQYSISHNKSNLTTTVGNIVWMLLFVIILCSVLIPLLYYTLDIQGVTVSSSYFDTTFIPVGIASVIATALCAFRNQYKLQICLAIAAVSLSYFLIPRTSGLLLLAALSSGLFLAFISMKYLCLRVYNEQQLSPRVVSAFLAHFGFAVLVIAISFNSAYKQEVSFDSRNGKQQQLMGYQISLKDIKHMVGPNYLRRVVELWVEDNKGRITILKPELRLYIIENQLVPDSDIYSYMTYDIYAVVSEAENSNITITLYYRPAISFIWLAAFLICGALMISFTCRDSNK